MSEQCVITPDHPAHKRLEEDVHAFLEEHGFYCFQLTYHERLPKDVVRVLQFRNTPTSLYLRGRADRMAVHRTLPVEFEWEAKTHHSKRFHDMTIEALPLAHHLLKLRYDVECLYMYRGPCRVMVRGKIQFVTYDKGFSVRNMPPIRNVKLPYGWRGGERKWFRAVLSSAWPSIRLGRCEAYGSGDPFVVVDGKEVTALPHWQDIVLSLACRLPVGCGCTVEDVASGLGITGQEVERYLTGDP